MKVALVYTGTTPELIGLVEKEIGVALPANAEVTSYQDLSILAEVRDAGYVAAPPTAWLVGMCMKTITKGTDAVLNLCSSVEGVTDAAQGIGRFTGIPIARMDEEVCKEAVRQGRRIGIIVTLPTTLNPAKDAILRVAREVNRRVGLVDALVGGAFGLDQEQFKTLMSRYAGEVADRVDVILFAQRSMAYCEEYIHEKYDKVVLSSPRFGAAALKDVLVRKGLLQRAGIRSLSVRNERRGKYA